MALKLLDMLEFVENSIDIRLSPVLGRFKDAVADAMFQRAKLVESPVLKRWINFMLFVLFLALGYGKVWLPHGVAP